MAVDCFLDANVLVYALSNVPTESRKRERARTLIADSEFGISAQVLQEFYLTVTRKMKQPILPEEAREFMRTLLAFPFVPVDWQLIQRASQVSERYQISYWDGAIIAAAERLQVETVYSEDLNAGQIYGSVRVLNPFAS